jgi:hypothetical protein
MRFPLSTVGVKRGTFEDKIQDGQQTFKFRFVPWTSFVVVGVGRF